MSIDAITYAKTLDVDNPMSRLLLFVLAENTFNDTGECKVGQEVLQYETRASESTVRRHLKALEDENVIKRTARPKPDGGRLPDAIELIGFTNWLARLRGQPEPVKLTGSGKAEPVKSANPKPSLLTGSDKDSRTSIPVQDSPTPHGAGDEEDAFATFWKTYPAGKHAHTKQAQARRAFDEIVAGTHPAGEATAVELIQAAEAFAASRPDPDFVPMATNWLNGARWLDDPKPRQAASGHTTLRDTGEPLALAIARSVVAGTFTGPIADRFKADVDRYCAELRKARAA